MASERRTSPVELFWDLVFAFAVTQVTTLLRARPHLGGPRARAAGPRADLVGLVGIRLGDQRAGPGAAAVRGGAAGRAGLIFIAGLAVPEAYGSEGTLFAVTYVFVRLLHLGLYADASRRGNASWSAIRGSA